jgi:ribonucleoside-diphosphate reductase alpha chain
MSTQTATTKPIPAETIQAFGGNEFQARVFWEKYALEGETRPEQMWDRVAREIASVEPDGSRREHWQREFRWLLDGFRFLPGGRIMHGAGNPSKITLLNCYFCAIRGDNIEAIYDAACRAARTYSRGGGVGIDITPLRPRGAPVHNAAKTSTGAVSFMELFSVTTGLIGQAGRRGALMITIADHHPDVLDFCRIKRDLTSVRYANISVRLSDAFMRAVERDEPWTLWFEGPEVGRIERTIRARDLWKELVEGARDWAEPGCLFWDRVISWGTSNYGGMTPQGTNPCSEIPLEDGGACDLGSLNLSRFVLDPFTPQARIDFDSLRRAVRAGVRFLDNVLTYNEGKHPLPEQEEAARRGRRIGLGITGLGDALIMLGLRYDSDEAIRTAGELQELIKLEAYRASVELAREKGPFPAFDPEKHLSQAFFSTFPDQPAGGDPPPRAAQRQPAHHPARRQRLRPGRVHQRPGAHLRPLLRPPQREPQPRVLHRPPPPRGRVRPAARTGPERAPGHLRPARLPEEQAARTLRHRPRDRPHQAGRHAGSPAEAHRPVHQLHGQPAPRGHRRDRRTRLLPRLEGRPQGHQRVPRGQPRGRPAHPEEARRRHQLVALADRVDSLARAAIPDLPTDGAAGPEQRIEATVRALADALEAVRKQAPEQLELISDDAGLLRDRPRRLDGPTYRVPTQFGTLFVTITERDGEPYEVFVRLGKAGSDTEAFAEAVGRLSSVILRMKGPGSGSRRLLELVYHQLEGIGGRTSYGFGPNRIRSVPDAIAAGLRAYLQDRGLLRNGNGHAEEATPQAPADGQHTQTRGATSAPAATR